MHADVTQEVRRHSCVIYFFLATTTHQARFALLDHLIHDTENTPVPLSTIQIARKVPRVAQTPHNGMHPSCLAIPAYPMSPLPSKC